jgi:argininosuccinate lyase
MSDTGRLTRGLHPGTRRMLFENGADVAGDLLLISEVDLAHLVMLERTGLIDRARAAALADRIGATFSLMADEFIRAFNP